MDDKSTLLDPSLDKQLKGHRNAITALYYSPNEHQLASSSLDNSILLWDLSGAMRSYRFRGHDEAVMDVTFAPSGKLMASASRDRTVRLWVPSVTGSTGMFKAHSQTVRSVQFSSDGLKLVTASDDKIVKLWSSANYKFISSFVGHTNWVRCARMSSDGSIIASCSDDKTTRLWNPGSGELIYTYKDQKGHGMYVAWHPSGCYIAVGTSHGNVKLYDIRTHTLVQYYSIHNDGISQVAFHPSGSYILTASKDGKMKILDLLEGHPIFTLNGHTGPVNAVNFSPSGDTFASAGEDKLVYLWSTNFTELTNENNVKENVERNPSNVPRSASQNSKMTAGSRTQGTRQWYLCYHSNKYPVANFIQLDDDDSQEPRGCGERNCAWRNVLDTIREQPLASSSLNASSPSDRTDTTGNFSSFFQRDFHSNSTSRGIRHESTLNSNCDPDCPANESHGSRIPQSCNGSNCTNINCDVNRDFPINDYENVGNASHIPRVLNWNNRNIGRQSTPRPDSNLERTSINIRDLNPQHCQNNSCFNPSCSVPSPVHNPEYPCDNIGNMSHIPRPCAPKPSICDIPSLMHRTVGCQPPEEGGNLYGFVKLKENDVCYTSGTIEWVGRKRSYPINSGFKTMDALPCNEPCHKKVRLDRSCNRSVDDIRECDCADMLPTVNAIVDHLNALHEAVDLIDLRLNTVEDFMNRN